jgi:hypothetical protein
VPATPHRLIVDRGFLLREKNPFRNHIIRSGDRGRRIGNWFQKRNWITPLRWYGHGVKQPLYACPDRTDVYAVAAPAPFFNYGSIDPVEKLGELARRRGIHFHVDAAWGTPLLFSRRRRGLLRGIELADTVTIDGHKQFHLPMGTSLLLFRDPRMATVIRKRANYMLQEGTRDLGSHSPEGSRSAA